MPVVSATARRSTGLALLVVLDQRFAFRGHGHDVIGGLPIGAQLGPKRCRELTFVVWARGRRTDRSTALIDDCALTRQHLRAALVAGKNQQDRIVLAFERAGEP